MSKLKYTTHINTLTSSVVCWTNCKKASWYMCWLAESNLIFNVEREPKEVPTATPFLHCDKNQGCQVQKNLKGLIWP